MSTGVLVLLEARAMANGGPRHVFVPHPRHENVAMPVGKEDTAKELLSHAAKTQDLCVPDCMRISF